MAIPRNTPVDYGSEYIRSGKVLITDPRSDLLLRKKHKKHQIIQPDYTEWFES